MSVNKSCSLRDNYSWIIGFIDSRFCEMQCLLLCMALLLLRQGSLIESQKVPDRLHTHFCLLCSLFFAFLAPFRSGARTLRVNAISVCKAAVVDASEIERKTAPVAKNSVSTHKRVTSSLGRPRWRFLPFLRHLSRKEITGNCFK